MCLSQIYMLVLTVHTEKVYSGWYSLLILLESVNFISIQEVNLIDLRSKEMQVSELGLVETRYWE